MDFLKERNISLDFFRGIMALFVCIGHFFYWNKHFIIPVSFILAVDFFLVLSGFVICHSIYVNKHNFNSFHFSLKRYARFFPVYITCVLISFICILHKLPNNIPGMLDIFRIMTLAQMLPINPRSTFFYFEPLKIAYTISAELWVGIIIFPVFIAIHKKIPDLLFPFLIMLILTTIIILNNASISFPDNYQLYNQFLTYGIIRCVFEYSLGILTYIIFIQMKSVPDPRTNSFLQIFLLVIFLVTYIHFNYHKNNDVVAPFFFAIFIFSLSFKNGILYQWTANRLGRFLGDISYALYLIHPIWVMFLTKYFYFNPENYLTFSIYIIGITLSAYTIHRFIEKPCLKHLNFSTRKEITP